MHLKAIIILLLGFVLILNTVAPTLGQDPFIPKYDAVKRSERCFTVTWEANNQFGAVWWADKVDFSADTSFNFVVYMGDRDGNGADGLAFVMHQDPRDTITDPGQQVVIGGAGTWDLGGATGDDGGGLGFAMHASREGPNTIPGPHGPGDDPENHKIQKSVAVEMDTWNNKDVPDGKAGTDNNGVSQTVSPFYGWDHTAVIYNGDLYGGQQVITDAEGNTGRILPLKPRYAFDYDTNPDGSVFHNIEDDRCYMFQIRWITNPDGTQTMQLWADVYNGSTNTDNLKMIMTHTDDMINNVFGGNPVMRFGFTGSTGGSINEQTICLLGENLKPFAQDDYASIPMNTNTVIDVESNDNDPDGDQLHVPIIVDAAGHGTATIFDSLDINYMRYTPNTNYVGKDTIGYITCDVNSTKCYAKCDTAYVYITVGCIPFDVDLTATSPNITCVDSLPGNGAAAANVISTFVRGTLWYEGFEDLVAGTTNDNGTSAWTSSTSGSCAGGNQIRVDTHNSSMKFRIEKADCEVVWQTGLIDISAASDVSVQIDMESDGNFKNNNDYLEAYYILDGGPETPFTNGQHTGDFGLEIASVNRLNGSTLQIIVRGRNDGVAENYYWDNIKVTGIGAGVPDVTYNWYSGAAPSGPIIHTGAINNGMTHGIYTVMAIDNASGCLSNPATVTIDSTGYEVPGGFIKQLSPFSNCELPYDGALAAGVINGTDSITNGYNFEWYFQEDPKIASFIQRTGPIAQNLESREYTVVITETATGCNTQLNDEVINAVSIPSVIANATADVMSCTNPNSGSGTASVNGLTAGYTFEWYIGPSIGAGPPDYTGATVNNFPAGNYTVQAIDNATSCPSDPATISISNQTSTPDLLVTVDSEQLSCDTTALTGQLTGAVDISGTPTTTGFTFNWYKGANDIIPARPGYTGGPTADQLEAGAYRLVVIEDGTNCTSFVDTLIQNMTVSPPDITSVSATDVTSCASPNGTITVNVVGDPSDFIYEVYKGNGIIADSLFVISNTNVIANIAVGNYTILAKNLITKCPTAPEFASIQDATIVPDANITSQDQVSCDPNKFTGQLTASMNIGVISDYTYTWYEDDFSGTQLTASSVDGEIISGLDSGNYALRITNKSTQCTNIYYPSVNISISLPVETVSSNPSTNCGPSGNGELIGTVVGEVAPYVGYTFVWESIANSDTLTTATATVSGVAPGDYLLTVVNDATACTSSQAPITINDNTVIPIPNLSTANNSSCDVTKPNGQIEVTSTNEMPPLGLDDYTYAWADVASVNAIATISGPNGEIANELDSGTYELTIVNSTTSCSNTVLTQIVDINIKPIIDAVTVTDATDCSEPYQSGATIASVNGGAVVPAGYTFIWTNLDGGPVISEDGSTITDIDGTDEVLPPGNYQVIAINAFNCQSDPITFEIKDLSSNPIFTINTTPNSSCAWDPSNSSSYANGTLAVKYSGPNSLTDYSWEREIPAGSGNWSAFGGNVDSIANLNELDNYRVMVTDDRKCSASNYASITKITDPNPVVDFVSVTDLDNCIAPNGELEVEVVLGTGSSFEYIISGSTNYNQIDDGIFQNLSEGNYTINAIDNFTQCQSAPIDTVINTVPDLKYTIAPTPSSDCSGTIDGNITISMAANDGSNEAPGTGNGFMYTWYKGTDTSSGSFSAGVTTPNQWSSLADNLEPGYYTVAITDQNTSCSIDTTIFLPKSQVPIFLDPVATPSNQCIPGNGQVALEIDPASFGVRNDLSTADYTDYEYILFKGNTIDVNWTNPGSTEHAHIPEGGAAAAPIIFSNLEPGTYTAIAKQGGNFSEPCFSQPVTFMIGFDYTFDLLSLVEITPDNTCATMTGNGQLDETNNAFYTTAGKFEYTWYKGTDTSVTGIVIEGPKTNTKITPDTLRAGQYSLFVEVVGAGPGLGCTTSGIVNLNKQINKLEATAVAIPKDVCGPGNGAIHLADISENNVLLGSTAGYGNFMLFDANFDDIGIANAGTGDTATPWNLLENDTYFVKAQNLTTLCITDPLSVKVNDISKKPVITIDMVSPDFSCNAVSPTGVLEAFADGLQDNAEYNYSWTDQLNVSVSDVAPSEFRASGLEAATYTITVEDISGVNAGCISTRDITMIQQPTTVTILSVDAVPTNQTICAPNGSIVIDEIYEDMGSGPVASGLADFTGAYTAQLLDKNLMVIDPIANAYAAFDPTTGIFGNMDIPAGTYYVQASNVVTGCTFGPATQVIIKDVSKNPIIFATLDNPDFACAGGMSTGQLTASFAGGTDGDNVPTNFNVQWYDDNNAPLASGISASNLSPGMYTLEVIDGNATDQFCTTKREYLVTTARHVIDITASGTDQTICFPDGEIQIDDVIVDGGSIVNPHLSWAAELKDINKNLVAPAPTESGFASDAAFSGIAAGTYFVQAQDNSTKCYSELEQVSLDDLSVNPVISIINVDPQYSLNPNPLSWTGGLTADITEANGIPDVYDLEWFAGIGTSNPINENMVAVDSLDQGYYTLAATNTTTGCQSDYSINVPFVFLEPTFNTLISPLTVCAPDNGSIEVTNIALEGVPDLLTDYTFNWHHDFYTNGDAPDATTPGDIPTIYQDINEGTYYIIAQENWWMLDSYPVKVQVVDSTTNPIVLFDATNYQPLTSCDPNVFADGALAVNVYEDPSNPYITSNPGYGYSWYLGDKVDVTNVITDSLNSSISGLPAGQFTILVTNLDNNCQAEKTFNIDDESKTPIVVASQTPNTNCPIELANGATSANVINSLNSYSYEWYTGVDASGTVDYVGKGWRDLTVGDYTVVAIDKKFATCISAPVTIQVKDATVHPTVLINELSPVINCDPNKPNGVLTATTQDGIYGHTFEWYLDGNSLASGPTASNLGLFDYELVVTNDITQCATTMNGKPTQLLSAIPPPNVDILGDRTSCLEPDGSATASISGNVTDYIFSYYNKFSGDKLTNFYEDYTIYGLDTSTYLVTATDRTTGCISEPTEFSVADESYYPEIEVIADPSNCQEPSGAATVILSDMTRDFKVTWYGDNGFVTQETELVYIPVGKYRVDVEGTDGCITSAEAEVKGDILIYNGVSANFDGLNEFFQVVCLEYFPENNVKIYNRAGMMVYEQDFYDMNDPNKRFEGISNKGASIMGTELPIGTYFYVVDKNDGSEAKVGYLELNR